jgi:hypothetical protein
MLAMGSYRNREKMNEHFNKELSRLSRGFTALNTDYKKEVLKTAQGLLRIQKTHMELVANNTGHSVYSGQHANG